MAVKGNHGELYELEASTEPVVVHRLDTTGNPVVFPDSLRFDPNDELN